MNEQETYEGIPSFLKDTALNGNFAGSRHTGAFCIAARCRVVGVERERAEKLLRVYAGRCNPPMQEDEAVKLVAAAYATPARKQEETAV